MNTSKNEIKSALHQFANGNLADNARHLLNVLGYHSERRINIEPNTAAGFLSALNPVAQEKFNPKRALVEEWKSVDLLFQLTDDQISDNGRVEIEFGGSDIDRERDKSYLFFALKLCQSHYTRTLLSQITRAINKPFKMPVMILFEHGDTLTFAVIDRRLGKRNKDEDVLEKATLIKGINFANPHRAHIDILFDLSIAALYEKHEFNNFPQLHEAWRETLDTEELNRQFYRRLYDWFKWAVGEAKFPRNEKRTVKPEEHVIRLITRLLFVWFVKEKGLVADELFDETEIGPILKDFEPDSGDSYYRTVLQNLFFATLNTEIEKRRFSKGTRNDHRNFSLYRYKGQMNQPDKLVALFGQTPFINGGLFDCLDNFKGANKGGFRIDCFSDEHYDKLSIPNKLFFHDQRGLISLLKHYKFTVEENTPIEQEVALDPELLGKVFENLLAAYNPETGETVRKQTGSYYTPRSIVDYMVEEALVAVLTQQVAPADGDTELWEEELRYLFDYALECDDASQWFDDDEKDRIVSTISELKILDPAVGSGAFPMSVLHKLTLALRRLDPDNRRWKRLQEKHAGRRASGVFRTQDDKARREKLLEIDETFKRYRDSDFGRKLYLIQYGIYGVDIQPVACQIAKLRFFISLAIEQEPDRNSSNFGIKPLPNLETRFVAANTLIGLELSETRLLLQEDSVQHLIKSIEGIREKHFLTNNRQQKLNLEDEEDKFRERLQQELEDQRAKWVDIQQREIERKVDHLPKPEQREQLREVEQKKYEERKKKFDLGFEDARKIAGWKPYDQNASAEWFDPEWMFGITDGFDVVIGNPPYVDSENMTRTNPELRRILAKRYVSAKGNWDVYIPFCELSFNLMYEKGIAGLITPNKWLSINYGKSLRQLTKPFVYKIVDYSRFRAFETTGVFPVVAFMSHCPRNSIHIERYSEHHILISDQKIPVNALEKFEKWGVFLAENVQLIVALMEKNTTLATYCDVEEAFTVSEAYKLSEHLREFNSSDLDVFKFVNAGTIDPFISLWGEKKTTYLKERYDCPVVDRKSFKRHFPKRYLQTTCSKIIVSGIRHFESFLDKDGEWIAGKSTVVLRNFGRISPELMVGLLNSRVVSFFLKECFGSLAMDGGINFSPSNVSDIPIPDLWKNQQKCNHLVEIVNRIIFAKSLDISADTFSLENEIDQIVYSMYNLTAEEIAIVEENTV